MIIYEDAKIYEKGVVSLRLVIMCISIILISMIMMGLALKLGEIFHLILIPKMITLLSGSAMILSGITLALYCGEREL